MTVEEIKEWLQKELTAELSHAIHPKIYFSYYEKPSELVG